MNTVQWALAVTLDTDGAAVMTMRGEGDTIPEMAQVLDQMRQDHAKHEALVAAVEAALSK